VPIAIWERVDASEPALNALSLGAQGVLLDTSSPADVMSCLKAIAGGGVWVPPSIAHAALVSRQCKVSKREGELMNLIACGLSNKEMAYRLGITVGTVKVYLSRLFDKLGVSDRYELALLALRQAGSSDASHRPADLCSRSVFVPRKAGDEWRLGAAGR
jgi:DNA-binding NarL/FixJ family response regulator